MEVRNRPLVGIAGRGRAFASVGVSHIDITVDPGHKRNLSIVRRHFPESPMDKAERPSADSVVGHRRIENQARRVAIGIQWHV